MGWKDFIFHVGKWWAIIAFAALLFFIVYPKYDMKITPGIIRINKITGVIEYIDKNNWVRFTAETPTNSKPTKVTKQKWQLEDDINILKKDTK